MGLKARPILNTCVLITSVKVVITSGDFYNKCSQHPTIKLSSFMSPQLVYLGGKGMLQRNFSIFVILYLNEPYWMVKFPETEFSLTLTKS